MTPTTRTSEVWHARIDRELATDLRADAAVLGLNGRTEIVRAALRLLHRRAAEERMAGDVEQFYGDRMPPLPVGVRRGPERARDGSGAAA